MSKSVVGVIVVGAAILFGYVGAAALATTAGRISLAVVAAFIFLGTVVESVHTITHSRRV